MTDDPIENAIELAHLTLHGVQFDGYWWSGEWAGNVCYECGSHETHEETDEVIHAPDCVYHQYAEQQDRIKFLAKSILGEE